MNLGISCRRDVGKNYLEYRFSDRYLSEPLSEALKVAFSDILPEELQRKNKKRHVCLSCGVPVWDKDVRCLKCYNKEKYGR